MISKITQEALSNKELTLSLVYVVSVYICVISVSEIVWNSCHSDMSWHKKLYVIKTEAHTKRMEAENWENALADFHAKAAAIDFCHPDDLVTWQQSAPTSDKLKQINSSCQLNQQSGYGENQDSSPVLPGSLANPFWFSHFFTHHSTLKMSQILNRYW